jgi:hypothetical protein
MINDIDDLQEIWDTLDTCYDQPEKYIGEALDPIIKFRKYRAFKNGAIRGFYSLLRSNMLGVGGWGSCTASSTTKHYPA